MTTKGSFVSTDGMGNLLPIKVHDDWDTGWSQIVPGAFGGDGHTDLLFYDRSAGIGLFVSTDSNGNISTINQQNNWEKDWDTIIPGNFGGDGYTDLFFYNRRSGIGLLASTDGAGNISTMKRHNNLDKKWLRIVPGDFGGDGHTDLLFYALQEGIGLFAATDGNGNISTIKQHTDWDKYWTIAPGRFGGVGYTDLLFYNPLLGTSLFAATDGQGNISTIKEYTGWEKNWQKIVPGYFGGSGLTDLLFLRDRRALFVSTYGFGNTSLIKLIPDTGIDSHIVAPGNFLFFPASRFSTEFVVNAFTDLLFYSARPPLKPTDLRISRITADRVDLAWTDNSNDEDGFRIRFTGEREGKYHTGSKSVPANSVGLSLKVRGKYEYGINVAAFNRAGESGKSNLVVAKIP
jgi:hypothetical protein